MPYTRHALVVANFSLPGGERASCGLRFSPIPDFLTQAEVQACADGVRVPWATFIATAGARMSTGVALLTTQVRIVESNGQSSLAAESTEAGPTAGIGTVAMPNEVAICVSIRTDTPTRSGRGRIYLPALAVNMGAGGKITSTHGPTIATAAGILFNTLPDALAVGFDDLTPNSLVVASNTTGQNLQVTSLRVGDVPDVQRRRQYDLAEEFSVVAGPFVS